MQSLLKLIICLLCISPARADSTVASLPVATTPLPYGSCIYVSQAGVDRQLCNNPTNNLGTAFGLFSAAANTVFGNFTSSSGTATANAVPQCLDTGGQHLNYVDGSGLVCGTSPPPPPASLARQFCHGLNPTGTTSTVGVMAGLACAITPAGTGRIHIVITGVETNSTTSPTPNGTQWQIYYGSGTAPTNGATLTGTSVGSANAASGGTQLQQSFSVEGWVTGLTIGTPYWVDSMLQVFGAGTATMSAVDIYIEEN